MIVEIHSTEEGLLVLLENDDVSAQVLIKIFIMSIILIFLDFRLNLLVVWKKMMHTFGNPIQCWLLIARI